MKQRSEKITSDDLKLRANELRKLPREKRQAILEAHAALAAKEYTANQAAITKGGNEISGY